MLSNLKIGPCSSFLNRLKHEYSSERSVKASFFETRHMPKMINRCNQIAPRSSWINFNFQDFAPVISFFQVLSHSYSPYLLSYLDNHGSQIQSTSGLSLLCPIVLSWRSDTSSSVNFY